MTTQTSLAVFWNGQEQAGFTVYGYWLQPTDCKKAPPHFVRGTNQFRLFGIGWEVWGWDLLVETWPSPRDWKQNIKTLLSQIVSAGAEVAWAGVEGSFVDPPELFDPKYMDGVWSSLTKSGEFHPPPSLNDELCYISSSALLGLREALPL